MTLTYLPTASSSSTSTSLLRKQCIAIIGTTGVGKTDFAVQLAKTFHGEIINSDALQIYQGLNVLTNKPNAHQRQGVPHHFLGTQPMTQPTYTVVDFEKEATQLIDKLHASSILPIVVGGTHYYMNYLLFGNTERCSLQDQEPPPPIPALSHLPSKETMYSTLQHYAPTLAAKWHPNDTRRIQRTLEHYVLKTKEKIQKNSPPSTSTPSHLQTSMSSSFEPRLTPTWLVFWVYRSLSQLDTLLDQRVDQMLELGLLKELEELHSLQPSLPKDRGIYQAIGCKEWDSYFEAKKNNPTMTTSELAHHYATCVQKMKMATQRYARKQLAWIQNRFWPLSIQSEHVHMYVIDGSSTGSTVSNRDPCVQALVQQFLVDPQRMPCPSTFGAPIINHLVEQHCRQAVRDTSTWQKFTCDLCQREMNGDHEWKIHLRSKKHLRHVRHLKLKQMKQVELIKCLESKVSSFHAT